MKAYERLLKYAVIKTPSDETSTSIPSSACQFDLANLLKKEMEELVVSNIQQGNVGERSIPRMFKEVLEFAYREFYHDC